MKQLLFTLLLLLHCTLMFGQKMSVAIGTIFKNNLTGGSEGKNYAAIVSTKESKKDIVTKSINFMKKYGFVPEDTEVNAIDASTSDINYDVVLTLTQCYLGMASLGPNKLFCKLCFEFHDSNVMIVFRDIHNEVLGIYWDAFENKSEAMEEYETEMASLMLTKTLIGKFLIHANMDIEERKAFKEEVENYFSDIAAKYKTYQ